jgi:hypothetical protein
LAVTKPVEKRTRKKQEQQTNKTRTTPKQLKQKHSILRMVNF